MPTLVAGDVSLHVEVDGTGDPVAVLAHGLTNSCRELARVTPFMPGTKVRFCFRGHGHSSKPESGYRYADYARDLLAVADRYGATIGCGTSLGAGALTHIVARDPDRFEKLIFLLPAALDRPFRYRERVVRAESLRALDQRTRLPARIREIIDDFPVDDREQLRKVTAPTLLICREGDPVHPALVGRILADILPNAELIVFDDDRELFRSIPDIVSRVHRFIAA